MNNVRACRIESHWGRTMRCYKERPSHIDAMFRETVAARGTSLAIVDGAERVTYAQLDQRAQRTATGLLAHGLRAGHRIAVLLGNRLEFVVSVLAIARMGGIIVLSVRVCGGPRSNTSADTPPRVQSSTKPRGTTRCQARKRCPRCFTASRWTDPRRSPRTIPACSTTARHSPPAQRERTTYSAFCIPPARPADQRAPRSRTWA